MKMDIVKVNLSELKPDPNNARKHSSQNILAIKQSLQENPQYRPFVVQKGTNKICVGNGMYAAMQELGIKEGWVEYRDLDDKQFARLSVADNRTAELAEWDTEKLKNFFDETDYKDGLVGWSPKNIEEILGDNNIPIEFEDTKANDNNINIKTCHCPKCGFEFEI